jgi:tripartite-type tricarboxylate transporter receptor subunit TctC
LYKTPLYDAETDFEPVALLVVQPMVLLARSSLPVRDLAGFGAHARANSNFRYGSAGAGSATHIACARLSSALGINSPHVPYQGGGPAMKDLIAGQIDFFCPVITIAIPRVKANTVKAVATLGVARSAALAEIPTAQEQGLSGFTATTWFAFFAPKGTPPHVVQTLNKLASAALDSPNTKAKLVEIGADAVPAAQRTPAFLSEHLRHEIEKYKTALRTAGIQPQ